MRAYSAESYPVWQRQTYLTDKAIKSAITVTRETSKPKRISNGGGLYFEVQPTGAAWWRLWCWTDEKEGC